MSGERRVDHLRPDRLLPVECPLLVTPDQVRVDCCIGGKDRGKTAGQAEPIGASYAGAEARDRRLACCVLPHHVEAQVVSREIVLAALARLALCRG
jgi:hypothetical protein